MAGHGTISRYDAGCRCELCRAENARRSRIKRERARARRQGRPALAAAPRKALVPVIPQRPATGPQRAAQPRADPGPAAAPAVPTVAPAAPVAAPAPPRGPGVARAPLAAVVGRLLPAGGRRAAGEITSGAPVLGAAGHIPSGIARCEAAGCREAGPHMADAAGPPTQPMLAEGRNGLPTRRCDRHLAELVTRYPPGTWALVNRPREAPAEPGGRHTRPNRTLSASRLPWQPAPGGGVLASLPRG